MFQNNSFFLLKTYRVRKVLSETYRDENCNASDIFLGNEPHHAAKGVNTTKSFSSTKLFTWKDDTRQCAYVCLFITLDWTCYKGRDIFIPLPSEFTLEKDENLRI